jgi:voltage-gated potassium channel
MSLARIRRRTWEVLEVSRSGDECSRVIDIGIMALVAGNVVAVILESVHSSEVAHHDLFAGFEKMSVAAFSAEFLLRFWSCAEDKRQGEGSFHSRRRYISSPMALADLIAIAPFYLSTFFAIDLRFMRILRLLRVVKLTRYSSAIGRMSEVVRLQGSALATSFFLLMLVMIFAASAVYVVEHDAQPEAFASIPAAMWWAVCTLTTVGYGDVTPITALGKFLASIITIVGIGMVALPTSLLASGFTEVLERNRRKLEIEAEEAFEDGIISDEEADAYAALVERLQVEPEVAAEIIQAAQRRHAIDSTVDCPHCGKTTL